MLQGLREGVQGWLMWVIIIILVIPFALWGIGNYGGFFSPSYVAEVNGTDITPEDFSKAYQGRYQQLQQMFGSSYKPNPAKLKKEVLDSLISQQLLTQHALKMGYRVNDQELVAQVHQMPAFSVGGKFSVDVYRARLQQAGYTPQRFEDSIRRDLVVRQLWSGIAYSAIATNREFHNFVALSKEQRKIGYVTVKADQFLDKAHPTDAEVAAYYNNHKLQFMTPDQVSIAYIELDADQLAKNIPVKEDKLHELYQQQKQKFVKQAQRKAAHILIAPKGKGPKADAQAKAKAESILKKLHHGADFAKLAKKYSDDPGSAKHGGDLGWVQRGEMVKPFEKALFSIDKVGEVVGPVKSQYGYHIIKLEGVRKPQQEKFAEVRDQLAREYRQKQAKDEFFKLGDKLSNLAFDHPDSLEPIHKALNLPIRKVDNVTRDSGKGIASNPKVRAAAFSAEAYKNGNNRLIKLGDTHAVVLHDVDRQPAKLKPLADVKADIVKTLKHQAAVKQAQAVAEKIAAEVRNGKTLEAAAKAADLKVQPAKFVGRSGSDVPQPVVQAAFAAIPPAPSQVRSGTVALASGDQAVFTLLAVKPGKPASSEDASKTALGRRLVQSHAQADLAAYVANLRKHADIDIQQSNISNY
ncbi:MAG TPA: SurA N-terminal domain-containing protein [Gammaproteobacteria bacterium]|nr:SurA N-terminal domain-containing protein [Gammaproteobacteria bacterium]